MDVLFAVMPFADVDRPAIGVSLLVAELEERGFSAAIEYFNVDSAESIGLDLYRQISDGVGSDTLLGEWFFADLLFGDAIPPPHEYVRHVLGRTEPRVVDAILDARKLRRDFVRRCADAVLAAAPKIVGFTTTFHQTCVSLAVAKLLKESPDPPLIVFGGANCEGVMGEQMVRSFPWVDYACTREGDTIFPAFVERHLRDPNAPVPAGLVSAAGDAGGARDAVVDLNALPLPQYRDYFAKLAASSLGDRIVPCLLMESARGCWWGAKHHCVFCGLNGDTIAFRSKAPDRVIDELRALLARHPVERVDFVDNILDMRYVNTVFPRLRDEGPKVQLFFEVKANLRYDQLRTLYDGGVRSIQPGIESLDDGVLRIMDKGCTAFQNVQLLRWCAELGIDVAWNIIGGFPGEDPAAYEATAALVPLLTHLPAPMTCSPIRLDRFSPLFMRSEQFALRRVRPTHAYYYVYPLDRRELENLAYFFEFEHADGRKPPEYMQRTTQALGPWWAAKKLPPEQQPALDAIWAGDRLELRDTRACAAAPAHMLTGLAAELYDRCDAAHTAAQLIESQRAHGHAPDDVVAALGELVARRLMIESNARYLSLAVFRVRRAAGRDGTQDGQHDEATAAHELLPAV